MTGSPARSESPESWPRELDADFECRGELGRGAMAIVYRALERELSREVAIKVVRLRHTVDDEAVLRLAREARTIAGLSHPNIVGLHAVRRLSDHSVALVMQLVPGRTLLDALKADGPFDSDAAAHVLREIARALGHAHHAGVIHRDVKPDNIFLDESLGRALLSDFGVARVMHVPSELTGTGTAIGTPTYMSPEQIDGGIVDGRSDLYSLGLVGWEMLTGERPWVRESLYGVLYRQKHDPLPPIDEFRDDVSLRLQYLIEGLLHKNPDRRWSDASVVVSLLDSPDAPPGLRDWEFARRRRRRATAFKQARERGASVVGAAIETMKFVRGSVPERAPTPEASEPDPSDAVVVAEVEPAPALVDEQEPIAVAVEPSKLRPLLHQRAVRLLAAAAVVVVAVLGLWHPWSDAGAEARAGALASVALDTGGSTRLPAADSGLSRAAVPGTTEPVRPPNAISVSPDRRTVAAGGSHGCSINEEGQAFCWGRGGQGQLGDGRVESRATAGPVSGGLQFSEITAGLSHTCGLTRDGAVFCWGDNSDGQLGDGSSESRAVPRSVSVTERFAAVRAGERHSCAISSDRQVSCWGANESGQLGDGTRSRRLAPVTVPLDGPVVAITLGWNHTCAIRFDGAAFCWGKNESGQLGDGTIESRSSPVEVRLPSRVVSIAAGAGHSCAVAESGVAYCWGQGNHGQLGSGTFSDRSLVPRAVEVSSRLVAITAGNAHSCARGRDRYAWCWGMNGYGQLGDGTNVDRSLPGLVRIVSGVTSLHAGGDHTCAMTDSAQVSCWGRNADGQVGRRDRSNALSPSRVILDRR